MNNQLSAFLAVSCLTHAAILLSPGHPAPVQVDIGGQAAALQVTVVKPPKPARVAHESVARTPPKTSVQRHPRSASTPRSTPPERLRQSVAAETAKSHAGHTETPATEIAAATPVPVQSSSLKVSERVSAALQSKLAESFEYPWLARKRGWQGLVTLSLHIEPDGMLSQWKVARTSGYSLLDRSALRAAKRIVRLPQADRLLNGRSLTLSIPVRYRLVDS
jgi:protein TonB